MIGGDFPSPAYAPHCNAPYSLSLASSASASSTSVWSDASQTSDDTSITTSSSDSDYLTSRSSISNSQSLGNQHDLSKSGSALPEPAHVFEVPIELRQHPRRTKCSAAGRPSCPPLLVRQEDRKVNFVENLVDCTTHIVETIWPTSSALCRSEAGSSGILPLRTFVQETLRRSQTSYSTLQVALYYLVLIKPHVANRDFTMEQLDDSYASLAIQCGRRMFLAALILSSKYLQDRNYSARAWSKISGLNVQEINQNEMAFLQAINWKLHVTEEMYNRWVVHLAPGFFHISGECLSG